MNGFLNGQPAMVRLEIDIPRDRIAAMILARAEEINSQVDAAVERALDEYNLPAQVAAIVNDELTKALKAAIADYFRYGQGQEEIQALARGQIKRAMEAQP